MLAMWKFAFAIALEETTHVARFAALAFAVVWCVLAATAACQEDNKPPEGFTALFNGTDLSGWYGLGHFDPRKLSAMSDQERAAKREADMADVREHWRVENGELVNDGHGVYLTTDREFGDFELLDRLQDRRQGRQRDLPQGHAASPDLGLHRGRRQVEDRRRQRLRRPVEQQSGAPGKDPLVLADKPFGQWNRLRILQVGARTTVCLNDKLVVDHAMMENFWDRQRSVVPAGSHPTADARRRDPLAEHLRPRDPGGRGEPHPGPARRRGIRAVFNGKDFTGWAGPVEKYEVRDGAIVCKPGKGGTIYTKDEYDDFVARLEFRLPPGGNNGLAIRYPGSGDTAYGHVRAAGPRFGTPEVCEARLCANTTARPTAWCRLSEAICGRPASGTSRRSR